MTSVEGSSSGNNVVAYVYGTSDDKSSDSNNEAPRFNGDPKTFSWWKTKMYSFIIGLDEELWDVLDTRVAHKQQWKG